MSSLNPVLYADDEPDDIFFMHHVWELAGISNPLVDVRDGDEAIEYLAGRGEFADRKKYPFPCLLLLDLNMPGRSGFDVLHWIRKQPGMKLFKVVIVSGSNRESDVKSAQALGVIDYIIKPSSPSALLEVIKIRKEFWFENVRVD